MEASDREPNEEIHVTIPPEVKQCIVELQEDGLDQYLKAKGLTRDDLDNVFTAIVMSTFSESDTEAFRAEVHQFILEELDGAYLAREDNPNAAKFVDESGFELSEFRRSMLADVPYPIDEPGGPQMTLLTLCSIIGQLGYTFLEAADMRIAITKNFIRLWRTLETEPLERQSEVTDNWLFGLFRSHEQRVLAETFAIVCANMSPF